MMVFKKKRDILFISFFLFSAVFLGSCADGWGAGEKAVRIGYFHGGRTHLFYRAYINGYFEKEKADVLLITKTLRKDGLKDVPKTYAEFQAREQKHKHFGRMTGTEIVAEMEKGNLDGGTIGEASFIEAVSAGKPIVAVAALGHDTKERPGHAFVLRKGLVVKKPEDLKGKTFTSRRSGPVDAVLTREFILSEGLKLSDVKIIDNMYDDELYERFADGTVDGGASAIAIGTVYLLRAPLPVAVDHGACRRREAHCVVRHGTGGGDFPAQCRYPRR